jgi:hypothetical protein
VTKDLDAIEDVLWDILSEQKKTNEILGALIQKQNSASVDGDEQRKKIIEIMSKTNPAMGKILKEMGL